MCIKNMQATPNRKSWNMTFMVSAQLEKMESQQISHSMLGHKHKLSMHLWENLVWVMCRNVHQKVTKTLFLRGGTFQPHSSTVIMEVKLGKIGFKVLEFLP